MTDVTPFSISREFDAPRDLVWEANTRAEHLLRWIGPPGAEALASRMDFRVGGRHHYGYRLPHGGEIWGLQTYEAIEPMDRIVVLQSFADPQGHVIANPMAPTWPRRMRSTTTFTDLGGRTRVTISWQPFEASDAENATFDAAREGMSQGFGGMFVVLEGYLELAAREVVQSRVVAAPRGLVWRAFSEPEHVNRWWGPDGFRNENVTMRFEVGGEWRFDMVAPDGTRFPNLVVYTEIVPERTIAFDHGDGERVWFVTTIQFADEAEGTRVTQVQRFPTAAERDHVIRTYGAIEGGKQHFAKLEAYLRDVLG